MNDNLFLQDQITRNDILMIDVLEEPRPQTLRARIVRTYRSRATVTGVGEGDLIEFVHAPGHWGNATLKLGDRAIVFLSRINERLYEHAWRGHLVIERIDGAMYASYQHRELWQCEDVPKEIKTCLHPDPKRPYASAIQLEVLERYIISRIGTERPDASSGPVPTR